MRLQELFETTEEDRALASLSSAIYTKLQEFQYGVDEYNESNETYNVGKIGDIFDTSIPSLDNINIKIQSDDGIFKRVKMHNLDVKRDPYKEFISGAWDASEDAIIFNEDHLNSNNMKTVVTHELRHALDDIKSDYKAGESKKYFPASNKYKYSGEPENTPVIPAKDYSNQGGEVNARFAEVLHAATMSIRRAYALPPDQIKAKIMQDLRKNFAITHIADSFPQKEKSPQYKRLMSRALDFITKEMQYHESLLAQQGRPKHATGSFN